MRLFIIITLCFLYFDSESIPILNNYNVKILDFNHRTIAQCPEQLITFSNNIIYYHSKRNFHEIDKTTTYPFKTPILDLCFQENALYILATNGDIYKHKGKHLKKITCVPDANRIKIYNNYLYIISYLSSSISEFNTISNEIKEIPISQRPIDLVADEKTQKICILTVDTTEDASYLVIFDKHDFTKAHQIDLQDEAIGDCDTECMHIKNGLLYISIFNSLQVFNLTNHEKLINVELPDNMHCIEIILRDNYLYLLSSRTFFNSDEESENEEEIDEEFDDIILDTSEVSNYNDEIELSGTLETVEDSNSPPEFPTLPMINQTHFIRLETDALPDYSSRIDIFKLSQDEAKECDFVHKGFIPFSERMSEMKASCHNLFLRTTNNFLTIPQIVDFENLKRNPKIPTIIPQDLFLDLPSLSFGDEKKIHSEIDKMISYNLYEILKETPIHYFLTREYQFLPKHIQNSSKKNLESFKRLFLVSKILNHIQFGKLKTAKKYLVFLLKEQLNPEIHLLYLMSNFSSLSPIETFHHLAIAEKTVFQENLDEIRNTFLEKFLKLFNEPWTFEKNNFLYSIKEKNYQFFKEKVMNHPFYQEELQKQHMLIKDENLLALYKIAFIDPFLAAK